MNHEFAYEEAQRHLKQRNRFAALAGVLGLTTVLAVGAAATRDETLVLVPVTSERIALSSGGIETHYLELVTRDTALMLLNRAPEEGDTDSWTEEVTRDLQRIESEALRIGEITRKLSSLVEPVITSYPDGGGARMVDLEQSR